MSHRPMSMLTLIATIAFSACAGTPSLSSLPPTGLPPSAPTLVASRLPTLTPTILPTNTSVPPTAAPALSDIGPFRLVTVLEAPQYIDGARLSLAPGGSLYAIIERSLYILDGEEWRFLTADAPLPILGVDGGGRAVAVSEEMAAVWDGTNWDTYGPEAGWEFEPFPFGLAPSPLFSSDGRTWVPGNRGLRVFDGASWQTYRYADMAMQPVEEEYLFSDFSLAEATDMVWVGECTFSGPGPSMHGRGARWFDGATWHGAGSPAATGCVTEIAVAPDGSVWLDVGPTLYRTDRAGASWKGWRLPKPPVDPAVYTPRFGEITEMAVDANGNVWLALTVCGGASCYGDVAGYRFDPGTGTYTPLPFAVEETTRLIFDRQGQGWLFGGGIFQIAMSGLEPISDGLQLGVLSVIQDKDGRIWVLGVVDDQYGLWVLEEE